MEAAVFDQPSQRCHHREPNSCFTGSDIVGFRFRSPRLRSPKLQLRNSSRASAGCDRLCRPLRRPQRRTKTCAKASAGEAEEAKEVYYTRWRADALGRRLTRAANFLSSLILRFLLLRWGYR